MTASYRKSNKHFEFHNENPKGLKSAGDCVVRALACALDITWEEVYKELCTIGFKLKRMPNENKVLEQYLESKGWVEHRQPRYPDNTKYTVREFAAEHNNKVCIVRVAGHLTTTYFGRIYDTWDCGHKAVGNYWTK